jgi:hypothetical protein
MPRRLLATAIFAGVLAFALAWARMEPKGLTVLLAPALMMWDVVGFLFWVGCQSCAERSRGRGSSVTR